METLIITKKSLKTWLHETSDQLDFILSKFYFSIDGDFFRVVEQGESKRNQYRYSNITVIDQTTNTTYSGFTSITQLSERLEQLNYPAFYRDGEPLNIGISDLNDVDIDGLVNGQVLAWDAVNMVWVNVNMGGGGGGVETVSGNIVDNTDPANPVVTLPPPNTVLIEATLSDLGVSTFDEVTPAKLAEYTATLDIEVGLNQDIDYKIEEGFTFDLLVDEAELFTNLGINDEATFTSWVEANISLTPTITDFTLADGRLRCNLSIPEIDNEILIQDFAITEIKSLRCFNNADSLIIDGSNITEIKNVANLTGINVLAITNSNIAKLDGIGNLTQLVAFNFNHNNISEIQTGVLDNLVNIVAFGLSNNSLTTAEFNKMNTMAIAVANEGTAEVENNTDDFDTSTTYATLLAKDWSILN